MRFEYIVLITLKALLQNTAGFGDGHSLYLERIIEKYIKDEIPDKIKYIEENNNV